jgi:hypothetical protein
VNFEINSVLPSLLLVFVEKVLTCLFTPPLGNFQHDRSEDTCLHQVVAQEDLRQHTQESRAARCLNKAIVHSLHLESTNKQHTKHVQSSIY